MAQWDWGPVAQGLNSLMMNFAQKRQYENLLKTLGTGMQGGVGPFGGPSSAPPLPTTTARTEDDNGMPIPGRPAPIMPAQGMTAGILPAGNGRAGEWDWMTPDRGPLGLGILPALLRQRQGDLQPIPNQYGRAELQPIPNHDPSKPPQYQNAGQGQFGGMPPQMMDILRKLPPQIGMPLLLQTLQTQMTPQGIKEIDPTKDLYDNSGRLIRKGTPAGKFGTRPTAGINPETGKPDQFVTDEQGNIRWLGTSVAPKEGEPFTIGNTRYDAQGRPIVTGTDLLTPEEEAQQARLRAAGRTSVSVENNLGDSLATGVGKGAADILTASHAAAQGAASSLQNSANIRGALDSGKVMAGPGTSWAMAGRQLFGGNQETLNQTRTVIQGLAKATVAARGALKGQGQVSDDEGRLLERAASGDIDRLTVGEIRTILDVNDRLARQQLKGHKTTLDKMRGADIPDNYLDIYSVDEPPEYQKPGASSLPQGWSVRKK